MTRICGGTRLYWPPIRRLLAQRFVSTVIVIVGQVFVSEPFQMLRIQRDYEVRHLAPTTSNPALRDSVLPWTADAGANGLDAARLQELDYIGPEFGIPVQHNVPLTTGQRERLSQLLHDPIARRMRRDVEVENAAAAVFDHEQAIEHTKRECGNSKEVERRDHFAMVVQEGGPALRLAPIVVTFQAMQISRHGRFGDLEPELEQFAMNARCSPARILRLHAPNQLADLGPDLRPSRVAGPRTPSPEQPEAGAVP